MVLSLSPCADQSIPKTKPPGQKPGGLIASCMTTRRHHPAKTAVVGVVVVMMSKRM
jgi:hypothetical protein